MIDVVIDTNVWISGIYWTGPPFEVIRQVDRDRVIACFSPVTLQEWEEETRRIGESSGLIDLYLKFKRLLQKKAKIVIPNEKISVCRDEDDNRFLEVAVTSQAEFVITGDRDLLTLKKYQRTKILSPKEFLRNFPQ